MRRTLVSAALTIISFVAGLVLPTPTDPDVIVADEESAKTKTIKIPQQRESPWYF